MEAEKLNYGMVTGKEWTDLNEEINKFNHSLSDKKARYDYLKSAVILAAQLKKQFPDNQKEINIKIKSAWRSITLDERKQLKDEVFGVADDISDSEDSLSGYKKVKSASYRKIALNTVHKPRITAEKEELDKKLNITEQEIVQLQLKLKKAQEQQQAIQTSKQKKQEEAELALLAIDYLTIKQQKVLKSTEENLQKTMKEITTLEESLKSLKGQLDSECDTATRTDLVTQITQKQARKREYELQLKQLNLIKINMEKRIKSDTYTWSDWIPLLSSEK